MAARTLAQQQRLPRATSQGLKPTGSHVLHMGRTPTPTPLATLATKGMAAATLVATLVVEWPAMFQALRPTESLVLQVGRTPTVTLGLAATRAMAATLALAQVIIYHSCVSFELVDLLHLVPSSLASCAAKPSLCILAAFLPIVLSHPCMWHSGV